MPLVCRLRDNKDLVDPTVQSLNRLAENVIKAEALSVAITEILSGAAQAGKPLIQKADSVPSGGLEAQPKRPLQRRSSNPPTKDLGINSVGHKGCPRYGSAQPLIAASPPCLSRACLSIQPRRDIRQGLEDTYDRSCTGVWSK